jgi:hypothetical protein
MEHETEPGPLDQLIDASIALRDRVWEQASDIGFANGLAVAYFTVRLPEALSRISVPPQPVPPAAPQP